MSLLGDFVRIRLKELEEAINFFNNPPKEIRDPATFLEGRGDALLESIYLYSEDQKKKNIKKRDQDLGIEIKDFYIRHESFLRSIRLREIGGAPTIFRGLKDFVNYGIINSSRHVLEGQLRNQKGAEITNKSKKRKKIERQNKIKSYLDANPNPELGAYPLAVHLSKILELSESEKTIKNDLKELKLETRYRLSICKH